MRHFVELPAFASLVEIPKLDVVLGLVGLQETLLRESVEEVNFPVQTARVSHLVLLLHLSVDLLNHVEVVPDRSVVLHDHLVALERPLELQVNFVGQGTHVEDLRWNLALRVVNRLFNGVDSFPGLIQLDASQGQAVVRIRPVLAHPYSLLKLRFGLRVLLILLVVAGEVEDRRCVRRVQLERLLVALEGRLQC